MSWVQIVTAHMEAAGWEYVETSGLLRFVREGRSVDVFKWSRGAEKHLVVREVWRRTELPYSTNATLPLAELDSFIEAGVQR